MPCRKVLDPAAIRKIERERLFAEHVLARLQCLHDLFGVQGRGRDQEHRVQPGIREQLAIVAIQACDAEILPRPTELILDRAAGGDQLCAGDAPREIFRMPAAQTAKARDTDAQAGRRGHFFP